MLLLFSGILGSVLNLISTDLSRDVNANCVEHRLLFQETLNKGECIWGFFPQAITWGFRELSVWEVCVKFVD